MKKQEKITPPTGNSHIKCGVENCAYHAPTNHCSLNEIQVGACSSEVTQCKNTECASFQMENEGCCR
ncbi:MAG: DUF1540 domain-containing protein [Eubacteriales bacterium]